MPVWPECHRTFMKLSSSPFNSLPPHPHLSSQTAPCSSACTLLNPSSHRTSPLFSPTQKFSESHELYAQPSEEQETQKLLELPSTAKNFSLSKFNPAQHPIPMSNFASPSNSAVIPAAVMDSDMLALAPASMEPPSAPFACNKMVSDVSTSSVQHSIGTTQIIPIPSSSSLSSQVPCKHISLRLSSPSLSSPPLSSPYLRGSKSLSAPSSVAAFSPSDPLLPTQEFQNHDQTNKYDKASSIPSSSLASLFVSSFTNSGQRNSEGVMSTPRATSTVKRRQASSLLHATVQLTLPFTQPIPDSIPLLSPSYPATLFGGLSVDDEHVTVWEPCTGKTVAGNAAPYRRNLDAWLSAHPGWEEKADELKSSKRRSAARRANAAANAFSAACCYPAAVQLASDAARHLTLMDCKNDDAAVMSSWSVDDFVRLQEALTRTSQEVHKNLGDFSKLNSRRWSNITGELGSSKLEPTVVYCALYMLQCGIAKSLWELDEIVSISSATSNEQTSTVVSKPHTTNVFKQPIHENILPINVGTITRPPAVSPASVLLTMPFAKPVSASNSTIQKDDICPNIADGLFDTHNHTYTHFCSSRGYLSKIMTRSVDESSFPIMPAAPAGAAAVLERSFRTPREPRVTVWNPVNGRTISGNAAPCRRNLQAWMKQHPGWVPKEEGQLSSSRRSRNRCKGRSTSVPDVSASGPIPAVVWSNMNSPVDSNSLYSKEVKISNKPCNLPEKTSAITVPAKSVNPEFGQRATKGSAESPHFNDALEGLMVLSRGSQARSVSGSRTQMNSDARKENPISSGRARMIGNCRSSGTSNRNHYASESGDGRTSNIDNHVYHTFTGPNSISAVCDSHQNGDFPEDIEDEGVQGCVQSSSLSNWSVQDEDERSANIDNVNSYMAMVSNGTGHEKDRNDENEDEDVSDSD